jgi:transcriptional regulator GlxA family with amidase domain
VTGFLDITAYVPDGASAFGLGAAAEVFADRGHHGLPPFALTLCGDRPGAVRTDLGLRLPVEHGPDRLAAGDLVLLLPGDSFRGAPSPALVEAVRAAYDRGAIVAGHCVGAYLLAGTGLLDGRRATTHWRFADDLAARYPAVTVAPDALYVDEGRLLTGAGVMAGIDLYLHLIRREHGAAVANEIARDIVVAPHRDGGQAQYIDTPVPADADDARLRDVLAWASANLDRSPSVDAMASRAMMSTRTFTRRFKEAVGATPHAWVRHQRLARAEHLLETTDLSIEEVARRVGYASATVLREQFARRRGVPPRAYRQAFGRRTVGVVG